MSIRDSYPWLINFDLVKKLTLVLFGLICSFALKAQSDTIPQDSLLLEKSDQKIYVGVNLNGSLPINNYADNNRDNPVAGFAGLGYGGGLFANFYWDSGLFMKLNADYLYSPSTFIDGVVDELNEMETINRAKALDNPEFHHVSVSTSGGYNIAFDDLEIYAMIEAGYAMTFFGNSSYRDANGFAINFDSDSDPSLLFGGGIGAVYKKRISLEISYINLGEPTFQAIENEPTAIIPVAVEFIRMKLGVVLIR